MKDRNHCWTKCASSFAYIALGKRHGQGEDAMRPTSCGRRQPWCLVIGTSSSLTVLALVSSTIRPAACLPPVNRLV